MNELIYLAIALGAGILLGIFFFGGLWWTVRKLVAAQSPALWFLASLGLRMGVALAGFYLVGRGDWKRLAACLLGFMAARSIVVRLTCQPGDIPRAPAKEDSHAP